MNEPHTPESDDRKAYATLSRLMPWTISGLLHVGAFLVMLMLVFFVTPEKSPAKMPHFPGELDTPPTTTFHQTPQPKTEQETTTTSSQTSSSRTPMNRPIPNTGRAEKSFDIIGADGACSPAGGKVYGPLRKGPGGTGLFETRTTNGGNSDDILYVIDRSGSMIDTFHAVTYNMALSIGSLAPRRAIGLTATTRRPRKKRFGILFFADGKPQVFNKAMLTEPTMANRAAAAKFLETVIPVGQTDPVAALKAAFATLRAGQSKSRPRNQLLFLLTDGVFPDNDAVIGLVRAELKKNPHVKLCTILYGHRPPAAEATMKMLAKLSHGVYRYVEIED